MKPTFRAFALRRPRQRVSLFGSLQQYAAFLVAFNELSSLAEACFPLFSSLRRETLPSSSCIHRQLSLVGELVLYQVASEVQNPRVRVRSSCYLFLFGKTCSRCPPFWYVSIHVNGRLTDRYTWQKGLARFRSPINNTYRYVQTYSLRLIARALLLLRIVRACVYPAQARLSRGSI